NLLRQLRLLNSVVFPIQYNDGFYKVVIQERNLCALAFVGDECVGAICCRREQTGERAEADERVYVMTLGVLAPYRRLQIGTRLLRHLLDSVGPTRDVCLHVQTSNVQALRFYVKSGFLVEETVAGYYKNNRGVIPPDAYFLRR
ncbi:N-alpha-acetyltransferase 50, NatE catalytic subunit, partial [Zopfochytrium polystomum]